jgi:putative hydrolase of HD superfamily
VSDERLTQQLSFILELDKAKQIFRQNPLTDGSRRENDAEHMWHLAVMTAVLAEHADEPVDVAKVIVMLLLHDVVEIDAGDTFVYDEAAHEGKEERERAAADRIFGLLPADQVRAFRDLWDEFEAKATPEARFAGAMDRLQPLLLNHASAGGAWAEHGIVATQVRKRNAPIGDASARLWAEALAVIDDAVGKGYLPES